MQNDPLAQLRDVHLPDMPAWWPPAPGWWILGVLVLALLAICVHMLVRWRQRTRPRREALTLLDREFEAFRQGETDAATAINRANALLKRLWLHVDGERDVASLTGDAWLDYLDRRSRSQRFTRGAGRVLGAERFAADVVEFPSELQALLKRLLSSRPPIES